MNNNRNIALLPLMVRVPNIKSIYQLSKLEKVKKVGYREFLNQYADYPIKMLISFNNDNSNPQEITAYGRGTEGYYLIDEID